ncbi:glycosyltransferase family 2 protein [Aquirufa ecclesiirivi]|uniref:glycosyltransferase family 2 protein n=1 Tax=Aquirufa ecclesiirivi TaxID=2715124 RepID=UPI0022A8D22A|nr:glycosyltransferase [Aquirufa ecclesiirivi]MCZ2473341.1 glycosyltransferase family 2 protein [Aquirufa ecclesiirivi]
MTNYLSVVIATLGGDSLQATIDSLNQSSIKPDEIIIAIPFGFEERVAHIKAENVQVLVTQSRGQVSQRCEGFKVCKGEYVIQLDDDFILETDCIFNLLDTLKQLDKKSACAPAFYFLETGISAYYQPLPLSRLKKLFYFLINGVRGYQEGEISQAGTEIGIYPENQREKIVKTQWLPGGMVLHHRDNLIIDNYFHFIGKAYSEDLFHSFELRKVGVSLYVVLNAKAWINDPRLGIKLSTNNWFKSIKRDYLIRTHLVKMMNKNLFRMNLYYVIIAISFLLKKVKNS